MSINEILLLLVYLTGVIWNIGFTLAKTNDFLQYNYKLGFSHYFVEYFASLFSWFTVALRVGYNYGSPKE